MKHQHIVHAKQEVSETWMATAVLERKRVIDGYVAAVGSARITGMDMISET